MSKKDYEMIAAAIKEARNAATTREAHEVLDIAAMRIGLNCKAENARFDFARWNAACDVRDGR